MLVDRLLAVGGAETLLTAIAQHLPSDRFEVSVCATREARGPLAAQLEAAGVEVFSLNRLGKFDLLPFVRLARYLRRRRVRVVHSHMFGSNFWNAIIGRIAGVDALVAHEHNWSFSGERLRPLIERLFIGPAVDAWIAGTVASRNQMITLTGLAAEKIVVIPGAHVPRPEHTGDLRAELGLAASTPIVGTIGVFRPEKRYDLLLQAFRQVRQELPGAQLAIAGTGPLKDVLRSTAAQLEIASSVHFLGVRRDVETVLRGLDVAVISSDYEGTSLFMVECITHGTPLVSTRVGGPAEYLEDGVNALLVPRRDPGAFAAAILSLLEDPDRGRALAAAAGPLARQFDIDQIVARYAALYERLLDGGPPIEPAKAPSLSG